jgi:hypothetical protein
MAGEGAEPPARDASAAPAELDFSSEAPGAAPAGEVDFSAEGIGSTERARSRPLGSFDHDRHIDHVRAFLAVVLVLLVAVEVLIALIAVALGTPSSDMSDLLEKVLSPTVALAGSAVGFYFAGERDSQR